MATTETDQLKLWRSDFGRSYTDRNNLPKPSRIEAWRALLDGIAPCATLEVGCNVGWNLTYLSALGWHDLHGVEPQSYAIAAARARAPHLRVVEGTAFALPFHDASFDLVFTSGVLIHIAPDSLDRALDEMYRVSRKYIVAIEYGAADETEIRYRGEEHALWKRDHGAAWLARYPALRLVRQLFFGAELGYDDCTAHLFVKP